MPATWGGGRGHGAGPGQQLRHGRGVRGQTLLFSDNLPFWQNVCASSCSESNVGIFLKCYLIVITVFRGSRSMILQAESKKEYEEVSVKEAIQTAVFNLYCFTSSSQRCLLPQVSVTEQWRSCRDSFVWLSCLVLCSDTSD